MVAFHVVLNFFAVVGHRFGSDALRDVLIKADVLASESVDAVLEERHYNRGLRIHKLVSEALERMRWSAFRKWNEHHTDPVDVGELFGDLRAEMSEYPFNTVRNQRRSMMHMRDRPVFGSADHLVQRPVAVIISGHVGPAPKVHKIST